MTKTNTIKPSQDKTVEKKRYFPCQYCKGAGGYCDDYDEYGRCMIPLGCSNCDDKGMIEIGGKIHLRNKALKKGMELMSEDREYSYKELLRMGQIALNL